MITSLLLIYIFHVAYFNSSALLVPEKFPNSGFCLPLLLPIVFVLVFLKKYSNLF